MGAPVAEPATDGGVFVGDPAGLLDGRAVCTGSRFPSGLFLDAHIQQFQVFTSVIELTFIVRS